MKTQTNSGLRLNPRLPQIERQRLVDLYQRFAKPNEVWLASSGSSRAPGDSLKLVALSAQGLAVAAQSVNQFLSVDPKKDQWLLVLPDFHVGGVMIQIRAQVAGISVHQPENWQWDPHRFVNLVSETGTTLTSLVPTQLHDLVQAGLQCPRTLRVVLLGGAALDRSLAARAHSLGWPVLAGYGMTETCALVASQEPGHFQDVERKLVVLPHVTARVTSEQILELKGDSLFRMSVQEVQVGDRLETQVVEPPSGHYWATSDCGHLQEDSAGRQILEVIGRSSDFVKIRGEGVSLERLRELLRRLIQSQPHRLADWEILALPHPRLGHELHLVYENAAFREFWQNLIEQFNSQVLPFERLEKLHPCPRLPRTALGKVDFLNLRQWLIQSDVDLRR